MKGNKSPGLDGLSVEFYKTFWPEIGSLVVESFNEAFQWNRLSIPEMCLFYHSFLKKETLQI